MRRLFVSLALLCVPASGARLFKVLVQQDQVAVRMIATEQSYRLRIEHFSGRVEVGPSPNDQIQVGLDGLMGMPEKEPLSAAAPSFGLAAFHDSPGVIRIVTSYEKGELPAPLPTALLQVFVPVRNLGHLSVVAHNGDASIKEIAFSKRGRHIVHASAPQGTIALSDVTRAFFFLPPGVSLAPGCRGHVLTEGFDSELSQLFPKP